MISSGTLAVTVPPERADEVGAALDESGTPFSFLGRVTERGVHILRDGKATDYVEICCEEDDLARMWTLYPRHG
jgi:hydrogenase expression/formation protein HypE